jgi:hypothetical protein
MRRRRLKLAAFIGFVSAMVFSSAYAVLYAVYSRPFQPGVRAIATLSFPGLYVGVVAGMIIGNSQTGFVLSVATVFNTLLYGALAYVGLVILGIGKDRDHAV